MTRPVVMGRPPVVPSAPRLSPAQVGRAVLAGVLVTLLGALIGTALTLGSPTLYAARIDVQYNLRVENASYFLRTDRNMTTQTELLTDRAVLDPVAASNGMTPDELAKQASATILNNSEIIEVQVLNPDRQTGMNLANAIAEQYLTVSRTTSPSAAIQKQLDNARGSLALAPPAEQPALQARVAMLQNQLDTEAISRNNADIVAPAYSLSAPAAPNRARAAGIGALLGIPIAALVVTVLTRRWTRDDRAGRPLGTR
jgi:hypothetical protein